MFSFSSVACAVASRIVSCLSCLLCLYGGGLGDQCVSLFHPTSYFLISPSLSLECANVQIIIMPIGTSSYQSFSEVETGGDDQDHVLIHVLPPESASKGIFGSWQNYIEDLDFFFIRIYKYHQRSGLKCIIVDQILGLLQFIFVVFFTIFLVHMVDYDVMFKRVPPPRPGKISLSDVILPLSSIVLSKVEVFLLLFASIYWFIQLIRVIQSIILNTAIKAFYREALKINDVTAYKWIDVQQRLISAQHHCLISQDNQLTELDIHNRILRHTNYMVALLNKGLIPVYYNIPFIGSVTYLSSSLIFNLNYLLFKGPLSLFETNWKLKSEYKFRDNRLVNSIALRNKCYILALINLILMPLIFLWQILNFFFRHVEVLRRNPNSLFSSRSWSVYAKLFCRHFNELDHLLIDRLNRGHKSASKYMNSFSSPFLEILAKHINFIASSVLAVLILLTVYDEDVITVEHVITIMTSLGGTIALTQAFIPDTAPMKYTQSELYTQILAHVHYIPFGYAPYSTQSQNVMATLFPYRILSLVEELISPLIVPFILALCVANKSQEIIDFMRNFTIEVTGTGDVCVFAMMNVKENGNSAWKPDLNGGAAAGDAPKATTVTSASGARERTHHVSSSTSRVTPSIQRIPEMSTIPSFTDNGKLELSLIHFKLHNPAWKPHEADQEQFIRFVTSQAMQRSEASAPANQQSSIVPQNASVASIAALPVTTSPRKSTGPSDAFSESTSPPEPPLFGKRDETVDSALQCNISDLQRQRSRTLNMYDSTSRTDSQLAMTLSTLFLNEYVAGHSSTFDSSVVTRDRRETDPLLASSTVRSRAVSSSTHQQRPPEYVKMHPLFDQSSNQSLS